MIDAEKLNALVDNELEPAERAEVEALLAQDPNAAAHVDVIKSLKSALQDNAQPVPCEDEWKACVKRLNEIDGVRKTKAIVDRWAWAMCSVLFIFIFSVGMFNRANPGVHVGTGDLTRAGMEKPIRDAFHWIKNELGGTPELSQIQMVSAQRGEFVGGTVFNLHLRDEKGDLGLVVARGNVRVEGVTPMDDNVHFTCQTGESTSVVWNDSGIVMILTAKRDANDLREIAKTITWSRIPGR